MTNPTQQPNTQKPSPQPGSAPDTKSPKQPQQDSNYKQGQSKQKQQDSDNRKDNSGNQAPPRKS